MQMSQGHCGCSLEPVICLQLKQSYLRQHQQQQQQLLPVQQQVPKQLQVAPQLLLAVPDPVLRL